MAQSKSVPEDTRGLRWWHLIHQRRQFVRTSSNDFAPTVPFSKFMKTKMLPQFECSFAWRQRLSFLSASFNGEGRAGCVSWRQWHNRPIPSALNLEGGSEKYLTCVFAPRQGQSSPPWLSEKFTNFAVFSVEPTLYQSWKAMLKTSAFSSLPLASMSPGIGTAWAW